MFLDEDCLKYKKIIIKISFAKPQKFFTVLLVSQLLVLLQFFVEFFFQDISNLVRYNRGFQDLKSYQNIKIDSQEIYLQQCFTFVVFIDFFQRFQFLKIIIKAS